MLQEVNMNIEEKLKNQIKENPILIYMKGTPYELIR